MKQVDQKPDVIDELLPSDCELCGDIEAPLHMKARCHPSAPLRLELDGDKLSAFCYVPDCNRSVGVFNITRTPLPVGGDLVEAADVFAPDTAEKYIWGDAELKEMCIKLGINSEWLAGKFTTFAAQLAGQSWVPVEVRLPDHNEDVWVSFEKRGEMRVGKAFLNASGVWTASIGLVCIFPILAWRAFETKPEPYIPPQQGGKNG